MPTGAMSKRKADNTSEQPERRRRRLSERPLQQETEEPEKREVLRRLFGRYCTFEDRREDSESECESLDENEDPLLDSVPVNMDPEQLGFLVCAQETLRFLHGRGFTADSPMFVRLRSRLLRGIHDIAAA